MSYGYARVSTDGQSVSAQVAELTEAEAGKVFCEVASGAKTDRTQLRRWHLRPVARIGETQGCRSAMPEKRDRGGPIKIHAINQRLYHWTFIGA